MKKIILALSVFLIFGLVSNATARTFSERQINIADPVSFTSPSGDAPGHRLYHMLGNNGYHWETPTRTTNRWVYFDANYSETKLIDRASFNFRVEHKSNKIRVAWVYVYNNNTYVGRARVGINKAQFCPEIRESQNDEGLLSGCFPGGVAAPDGEAFFAGGIRGNRFRFWFIGELGESFSPQITEVNFFRSESTK